MDTQLIYSKESEKDQHRIKVGAPRREVEDAYMAEDVFLEEKENYCIQTEGRLMNFDTMSSRKSKAHKGTIFSLIDPPGLDP